MSAIIEAEHLHKRYGERIAVDDVSFAVGEGEIFGVLGPNGAGKTTTVEMVGGLRRPDGGSVRVLGRDPYADRAATTRALGMQLQESGMQPRIRVLEAVRLFASFHRDPLDPMAALASVGLTTQEHVRYDRLSGGQKQRLAIAIALVGRPRIVVLDELTTGLDPEARRETWGLVQRVRDGGVTVLLVTHVMEEAERLCDRIAIVREGRIAVLDTPAAVVRHAGGGQRMRFRPSGAVAEAELLALDHVCTTLVDAHRVEVTGDESVVAAVTSHLARRGIVAHDLRVETDGLDAAYLQLMGRRKATG